MPVRIQNWFELFLQQFYGIDREQDNNIKLKEVHSRNVANHMQELARSVAIEDSADEYC